MQKIEIYLANAGSGPAIFSTDLGHIFGSNFGNEFGAMLRTKGPQKPEISYIVRIHSFVTYTDLIKYKNRWRHERSIAALLSFYFEAQVWRHYNYWTVQELSDI